MNVLLHIFTLIIMTFFFKTGNNSPKNHPFDPCPDSPNCVIDAADYSLPGDMLFHSAVETLNYMKATELQTDENNLKINAVFRIRFFGFKDDLLISIEEKGPEQSRVYIRSASRTGYSDLGVNRRRINNFFTNLENKIITL